MLDWSRVDAPWLGDVDRTRFAGRLDSVRRLDIAHVVSCHLPPATGRIEQLLLHLTDAPDHPDHVGPDHAAFEEMLSGTDTI